MGTLGVQEVIDDLAERLQRSVVVDDPSIRLLWASRHYGDEDEVRTRALLQRNAGTAAVGYVLSRGVTTWTAAGVIPPHPGLGMHARACVPIRWRGELLGLLLVVDVDGTMTTSELTAMSLVGEELAPLVLGERGLVVGADVQAREATVEDLLGLATDVRPGAVRALAADAPARSHEHVRVIELEVREGSDAPAPSHVAAALRHAVEHRDAVLRGPTHLHVVRSRSASVLLGSSRELSEEAVGAYSDRLLAEVDHMAAGRFTCVAGVGSGTTGLDQAWSSAHQARLASRVAMGTTPGRVVHWAHLGAQSLVSRLPLSQIGPETMPAEMQRLIAIDKDGRLVETVRAFLDHGGDMPATAAALHIHRTTLYYRLDRVTELAALDLGNGATRLALHLSLAVLDAQRSGGPNS